ncbi:putative cytochrome P450 [Porphyridium purpureum]|uniref:Putative cytochrome P450 n=1 Tax=Porphyridium purpureum TaxID=35688 RepID=A0A5J4Z3X9_PORPP|nr:putative cytochrome P450 [Porphyridium purpureum]|eukprot:POR9408..scf295_1
MNPAEISAFQRLEYDAGFQRQVATQLHRVVRVLIRVKTMAVQAFVPSWGCAAPRSAHWDYVPIASSPSRPFSWFRSHVRRRSSTGTRTHAVTRADSEAAQGRAVGQKPMPTQVSLWETLQALQRNAGVAGFAVDELRAKYGDVFRVDLGVFKPVILCGHDSLRLMANAPDSELSFGANMVPALQIVMEPKDYAATVFPFMDYPLDPTLMPNFEKMLVEAFRKTNHLTKYRERSQTAIRRELARLAEDNFAETDFVEVCSRVLFASSTTILLGDRFASAYGYQLWRDYFELEALAKGPGYQLMPNAPWNAKVQIVRRKARRAIQDEIERRIARSLKPTLDETDDYLDIILYMMDDVTIGSRKVGAIVDQIMSIFLAMHITTVTSASWTTVRLAQDPGAIKTIRDELASLDLTQLASFLPGAMRTLDAYWNETMRIATIGPLPRWAMKDIEFQGVRIPAKSTVVHYMNTTHLDPTIYPDPLLFDPNRFLDPQVTKELTRSAKFWKFGVGAHTCTGSRLGEMVLKLFWTELLSTYEISTSMTAAQLLDFVPSKFGAEMPKETMRVKIIPRT